MSRETETDAPQDSSEMGRVLLQREFPGVCERETAAFFLKKEAGELGGKNRQGARQRSLFGSQPAMGSSPPAPQLQNPRQVVPVISLSSFRFLSCKMSKDNSFH